MTTATKPGTIPDRCVCTWMFHIVPGEPTRIERVDPHSSCPADHGGLQ